MIPKYPIPLTQHLCPERKEKTPSPQTHPKISLVIYPVSLRQIPLSPCRFAFSAYLFFLSFLGSFLLVTAALTLILARLIPLLHLLFCCFVSSAVSARRLEDFCGLVWLFLANTPSTSVALCGSHILLVGNQIPIPIVLCLIRHMCKRPLGRTDHTT